MNLEQIKHTVIGTVQAYQNYLESNLGLFFIVQVFSCIFLHRLKVKGFHL